MPHYRLLFAASGNQPAEAIEFVGEDAARALFIAQSHERPAQLWENGRHLCTLHRAGPDGEVWIISPDTGASAVRAA